ncbi:glutamate carboxypeptidase [Acinetobacter sp. ANC 4558]|uniref:glutamate carboxypeptidase n=1 Tax=Acinetobacter sp. ANC 4558 TaxID=1977876 RepID=UPI000A3454D6|nr:glutamate carboxypeptidase [Acinetobacter sp. ANC 4558]OTG88409.1 glutamate carboxypeptidase [Acinetobacter sp. ANC 4558]
MNFDYFFFKKKVLFGLAMASLISTSTFAVNNEKLKTVIKAQEKNYLVTLKDLVNIESDSKNIDGLKHISKFIAEQLKLTGAEVNIIQSQDIHKLQGTPEELGPIVKAVLKGHGKSKIMLIAHMDTVYPKGQLKDNPFKIEGNKAYGLGVLDDKQGIALIVSVLNTLKKINYQDYGTITVLVNADEEISSPSSRKLITDTAKDQDIVLSFESSGKESSLSLATSGIASAHLNIRGKASHAGSNPEEGVNALTELSYQISQMQDLSQPEKGVKLNWTVASAGKTQNVIPDTANAYADVRALKLEDFHKIEKILQERIKNKKIAASEVTLSFEVIRPPLITNDQSIKLAKHAQSIYQKELNLPIEVRIKPLGGGTDAAFAGLESKAAIVEGIGLRGDGFHNAKEEYIVLDTIVPRIYLATRLIIDASSKQ